MFLCIGGVTWVTSLVVGVFIFFLVFFLVWGVQGDL